MTDLESEWRKKRWRLILGKGSESVCGGLSGEEAEQEIALSYLYDREYGGRNVRGTEGDDAEGADLRGGDDDSRLTIPDWINKVHELFPQKTIERIEKDALERYKLEEMVTNPELLKRAKPSPTLLKAVLRTKHLMNQEVLALARKLVRQVVSELMEKLAREIETPFGSRRNSRRRSYIKIAKNFDAETTIRRNLANYDPQLKRIAIQTPYFNSRVRHHADKWQIIILVDQSGSMVNSVIHSAITASIFWNIKSLRTHLCAFDTNVVDLTADCTDPVETLMKVQLGGGTNIAKALTYAETLVANPRQTIIILVTDFFEGGTDQQFLSISKQLIDSGVHLLGLAALDEQAKPHFNRRLAEDLAALGAHVGAMTPGELATWIAEKIQ